MTNYVSYSLIGIGLLICSSLIYVYTQEPLHDGRIHIVCTTTIIADTVRHIGGDLVHVHSLMGPGVDPHIYRPTHSDMKALSCADLILYNGLHLEGKMTDIFATSYLKERAVSLGALVPREALLISTDSYAIPDPHIWFDVQIWKIIVQNIYDLLLKTDSITAHHDHYTHNTKQYLDELETIHTYMQTKALLIPSDKRILITAHDAFHYFGRTYGFSVHPLQPISSDADIGTQDIQQLADFIVQHQILTIFVESCIPHRTLRAVQEAVHARGFKTHIGPELYADALAHPKLQAGTYIGMLRYTIDTIVDGLQPHLKYNNDAPSNN